MSPRRRASLSALALVSLALAVALATALAGCSADNSVLDAQRCDVDQACDPGELCNADGFCVAGLTGEPCDGLCGGNEVCDEATDSCLCGSSQDSAAACGEGQLCCASGCLDIQSDPLHCGGCDVVCGEGESCSGGFCVCGDTAEQGAAACAAPQVCCNDTCTNPGFDPACCGEAREDCMGRACIGGACKCAPGTDDCDPDATLACATNTLDSPVHCGMCNTDPDPANNPLCAAGQECFGGQCSCDGSLCEAGEACCNGTLCLSESDTMTDARNCGGCGQVCPPNHVCTGATCTCDGAPACGSGETCCGSPGSRTCVPSDQCLCDGQPCLDECCPGSPETCVDLAADTLNCGTCGNACGTGQSCVSGVCSCDDENLVNCDGACVDRRTDTDNCGTCGNSCGGGQTCCGGACVDTDVDIAHCGGCGVFCNGDACDGGACVCEGQPVDLTSDLDNCGSCANSCQRPHLTGAACSAGSCDFGGATCEASWGDCVNDLATDGCETFLLDDEAHCGGCGLACPSGQSCAAGACLEVDVVVEVEVGLGFSCARRASGVVECWGSDDDGQLGNAMGTSMQVPAPIAGAILAVDIALGDEHACAATVTGEVWCWGRNDSGEVGLPAFNPSARQSPSLVPLPGVASRVAAGRDHSCAVVDRSAVGGATGEVWCWGDGASGMLGGGNQLSSEVPVRSVGLSAVVEVAASERNTCAVKGDGTLWCWGSRSDSGSGTGGACGAGDLTEPCQVPGVTSIVDVSMAKASMALDASGAVHGWGKDNSSVLLGFNGEPPMVIASGFARVDTTRATACGVTTAGGAQCWGDSDQGQTGTGLSNIVATPTDVVGLQSGVVDISVALTHACAVRDTGGVVCWGNDTDGQLGNGPDGDQLTPEPVVGLP